MIAQNMRFVELNISRLADSGVLGDKETAAIKSAYLIIAQLRRALDYDPSAVTAQDVVERISALTGERQ